MKKVGKFVALSILALLIISFLANSIIAPETAAPTTQPSETIQTPQAATQTIGNKISEWWSSSSDFSFLKDNGQLTTLGSALGKILLMILLGLMVYSILGAMVELFHPKVRGLVAFIVAILGFLFIPSANIQLIVANYEALGITLTTILPLIIVLMFTIKMSSVNPEYSWIINPAVIILFGVYLVARWAGLIWATEFKNIPILVYVYPISLIILITWLFSVEKLGKRLAKKKTEAAMNRATRRINKATRVEDARAASADELNEEEKSAEKGGIGKHLSDGGWV